MNVFPRSFVMRCLAVVILHIAVLSSTVQAEEMVYAITDVQVTDNRQAVLDNPQTPSFLPDYTGVTRHAVTQPYVQGNPETEGRRCIGYDVNTGIRGTTTTIWVKYERLSRTSGRPVLVDIAVSHWPNWKHTAPDADFRPANGNSARIMGALTTNTKGSCWQNGLDVKYKPLRESSSWVLGLYLHCTQNNIPWVPSLNAIEGIPVTAERAGIDIHKGAGGSFYYLIKLRGATTAPSDGQTYVWRDIYQEDFNSGYGQISSFEYQGSAYLLGSKHKDVVVSKVDGQYTADMDSDQRVFYLSKVKPNGAGWQKNIGTFTTPPAYDNGDDIIMSWAVFYLDSLPYVAAFHYSKAGWQCTFLRYTPDASTFQKLGTTTFTGWNAGEKPYVIPLQLTGGPYLLVFGGGSGHVYRILDICKLEDAGKVVIGDQWRSNAGLSLGLVDWVRLATFQLDGGTYVFGFTGNNKATIWQVNEEPFAFKQVADGLFPESTFMVLPFRTDNRPYLFSLDKERKTGNIWRIKDRAAGWERVYWADHRVERKSGEGSFLYQGYLRQVCTTFELDGSPYLFMKYFKNNGPVADTHQAYISHVEKRNWIRVVNTGWYVAKFYIQYMEDGRMVTKESGNLTRLSEKVWHLPSDTRTVLLNAQGHTGLKWNRIHRGDIAVNCTYTVGGTAPDQWLRVTDATGEKSSY